MTVSIAIVLKNRMDDNKSVNVYLRGGHRATGKVTEVSASHATVCGPNYEIVMRVDGIEAVETFGDK